MKEGEYMKSIIAENVKRIVREKGMLQSAVAKKAGYNPKVFSNMLNGRKVISDFDVSAISQALDVSPNELFGWQDRKVG